MLTKTLDRPSHTTPSGQPRHLPVYGNLCSGIHPSQYARRSVYVTVFILMLLGSLLAKEGRAESPSTANSSIPGGTIPGNMAFLPLISRPSAEVDPAACPDDSTSQYSLVPAIGRVAGQSGFRLPLLNPDLNLAVRGYASVAAEMTLIDINGPTDPDAPQIADIFAPARLPRITGVYQVYDWNWTCDCLGLPLQVPAATLVEVETTAAELLAAPSRQASVYGFDYIAMVLYAEASRLTLAYTREDTPAMGYVVHLEGFCVDPNLLDLYTTADAAGRFQLPALRTGQPVGTAKQTRLKIAVRDTGMFMDPRSRKDWWQGY